MAEFEELQLRVTLTDQASRPLQIGSASPRMTAAKWAT